MRVVVLWLTPNEDGLTAAAKDHIVSGLQVCQEENLEVEEIHLNRKRINHCIACAGGTGLGAIECLHNMEECIKHMGMRAYDRVPVNRFNKDYMLPALEAAGNLYGERIPDRFDMQY